MVTARWLICDLGKPEKIQEMYYAILETGRRADVVPLRHIAEIYETNSDERDCVITMGSIWGNSALKEVRPNWFGNFHNRQTFLCSTYYSYWGKYITQKQYVMLTLSEVLRRADWLYEKFSIDGKIFIRPDSGEKEFAGEVVDRDRFEAWKESIVDGPVQLCPRLFCVVSSPVNIQKEMRLVIADKKVPVEARGLTLNTDIKDGSYEIMGDQFWMQEAINNLIENSIRYTKTGTVTVGLERKSDKILFSVKDTGIGITDEDKQNLFTDFIL